MVFREDDHDPLSGLDDEQSTNENEEHHDDEEEEDDDDDDDDDDDFEDEQSTPESKLRSEKEKIINRILHRISSERVPLRVHDVLIKGNTKTKDSLIEAEIQTLRTATSAHELFQAANIANARLRRLDIFDSVKITLDSGPPEFPGTCNVIVQVVEAKMPLIGSFNFVTDSEARSRPFEGLLRLKNLFGYGDFWDGSISYRWDQASELSAGVSLPRFMRLFTPFMAKISLLSQDWLNFSSYKEQALGLSLGLLSTRNHELTYNLSWRTLTDPLQMASKSIRRQLGHGLLSHFKYTYKIDRRNSTFRPTKGFAFVSSSQIGGIFPDYRSLHFIRQEFDLRYALSLGFARAALNVGIAGGVLFPWGSEFTKKASLPDRFFLGGNLSHACTLGGPTSLWGFNTRGVGPSEPKSEVEINSEDACERDYVGGDLAATAFADLSFDLPLKVLRDANIHAHVFASAGSLTKLNENSFRDFSFQMYRDSFRYSAGFGLIVPTKLFGMEVNYCHILKQHEHDGAKSGVQFRFSSSL